MLHDPSRTIRDHAYHCYPRGGRIGRAIRTARYRLIEWKAIGEPVSQAEYELYDYVADPAERRNLAGIEKAPLEALKKILARHPEAIRIARR